MRRVAIIVAAVVVLALGVALVLPMIGHLPGDSTQAGTSGDEVCGQVNDMIDTASSTLAGMPPPASQGAEVVDAYLADQKRAEVESAARQGLIRDAARLWPAASNEDLKSLLRDLATNEQTDAQLNSAVVSLGTMCGRAVQFTQ